MGLFFSDLQSGFPLFFISFGILASQCTVSMCCLLKPLYSTVQLNSVSKLPGHNGVCSILLLFNFVRL